MFPKFGRIQTGLTVLSLLMIAGKGEAAAPSARVPSLPRRTIPQGMLELPIGGTGRILTSRSSGTTSARKMLTSVRTRVSSYFTSFKLVSVVADPTDRALQATFTAKLSAMPIRGEIAIRMQGAQGEATLRFDHASTFQQAGNPTSQKVYV